MSIDLRSTLLVVLAFLPYITMIIIRKKNEYIN